MPPAAAARVLQLPGGREDEALAVAIDATGNIAYVSTALGWLCGYDLREPGSGRPATACCLAQDGEEAASVVSDSCANHGLRRSSASHLDPI